MEIIVLRFQASFALIVVFALSAMLPADEPRQIIERAIKAQGGMAVVSRAGVYHAKIKGVFHEFQANFTGNLYSQPPAQSKLDIDLELAQRTQIVFVLNGDKGWTQEGNQVAAAKESEFKEMHQSAFMDFVQTLFPLLNSKEFELTMLPPASVGDRPVIEVKVVKKNQSDIVLSFDKESGLLVKMRGQRIDPQTGKDGLHEMFLSDYREVNSQSDEEAILKEAKVATSDAGLLAFLRQRTLSEEQHGEIQKLIRQLGDSDFDKREGAKKDLIAKGALAIGSLNEALKNSDTEIAAGAKECLMAIDKGRESKLTEAVVRLLALHSSSGGVKALLDYLPCAADDSVAGEVRAALDVLAFSGDKPGEELELALQDKEQRLRATAKSLVETHGRQETKKPSQKVLTPGLKMSMKRSESQEGKKVDDWEITKIVFFNRLEDRIFAKP
jgi:hypothetical protein